MTPFPNSNSKLSRVALAAVTRHQHSDNLGVSSFDYHQMTPERHFTPNCSVVRQKVRDLSDELGNSLCKVIAVAGLLMYLLYILLSNNPFCSSPENISSVVFKQHKRSSLTQITSSVSTTNISHIVFGIASSVKTWRYREPYIDIWWRPNKTRGFVWFDQAPDKYPWPAYSPPFRISEDVEKFHDYKKHGMPFAIRMARVVSETFNADKENVRWYVMADDDTVLFIDNLVELLAKYDHNKYFYIGSNSECMSQNYDNSFTMAFGGAGYAMSFPLAKALARILDGCFKTYPTVVYGSDLLIQSCISELGVSLTREAGFHQIDLTGDISGLLSAHPQAPLISLHHIDVINPIFPSMTRVQSLERLMNASRADSSRLLQQVICYDKRVNWSLAISWGYSAQIYENIHPPSFLERPLQTFHQWRKDAARPPFMFNTRFLTRDPCAAPHLFFFESVDLSRNDQIITNYVRRWPRQLPSCSPSGNHSADMVSKIRVSSPLNELQWVNGKRRECCEVIPSRDMNITDVRVRACMESETIGRK